MFLLSNFKKQAKKCGVCSKCKKPNTGYAWCNKCDPSKDSKSGISEIDQLIYDSQLKTKNYEDILEWISYNEFAEIEKIGEGGFASIYSAVWMEGAPKFGKKKYRTGPITVALKRLKNSNMTEAFINEIKIHNDCNYANFHITNLYGITKDRQTNELIMVLEYAFEGNLREYLKNHFSNLKWEEKLEILINIADNLEFIHNRNYIHKDLHSGNILQFYYNDNEWFDTKISDLGLAQSITQSIDNSKSPNSLNVYGVLPYVAPEVLGGKPYSFASDVYSFGIIMVEVSTGKPPYVDVPHDEFLALKICNGMRPTVTKGTPQCYIDLINKCLDANPDKRPSSEEILEIIRDWRFHNDHHEKQVSLPKKSFFDFSSKKSASRKNMKIEKTTMVKEFIDADRINPQESHSETTLHPEAYYASRIMSFTKFYKPVNSIGVQIEEPKVSQLIDDDTYSIDLIIDDV